MAGTMSLSDLRTDHKAALGSTESKFKASNNADFDQHLHNAALGLSRIRLRTLLGEITLIAGQSDYAAPTDLVLPKTSKWGKGRLKPWQPGFCRPPRLSVFDGDAGKVIELDPAPSSNQISLYGDKYRFFYLAQHHIDEDATKTTIDKSDRDLLLLLALIQAMIQLAIDGVTEPVQLHRGMGSTPKTATPSAMVEMLNKQVGLVK